MTNEQDVPRAQSPARAASLTNRLALQGAVRDAILLMLVLPALWATLEMDSATCKLENLLLTGPILFGLGYLLSRFDEVFGLYTRWHIGRWLMVTGRVGFFFGIANNFSSASAEWNWVVGLLAGICIPMALISIVAEGVCSASREVKQPVEALGTARAPSSVSRILGKSRLPSVAQTSVARFTSAAGR